MKSIEIVVSPTGEVSIDAIGFKGADCAKATEFLEAALGVNKSEVKKPEFHQQNVKTHQQKVGS